uniref:Uncharacterized protein n=1 Tax=Solanum lycopersicum TaxID=4081 RepID=K4B4Q6_SOLLC
MAHLGHLASRSGSMGGPLKRRASSYGILGGALKRANKAHGAGGATPRAHHQGSQRLRHKALSAPPKVLEHEVRRLERATYDPKA